jgi:hypothetical protein
MATPRWYQRDTNVHERRDDQVLRARERAEVHERRLQLERGPQRSVVGLVDRTRPVGVRERATGRVEGIGVRVLQRRRQRQGRRTALGGRAVDALVEGSEADAPAVVLEAFAQPRERHEIVVALSERARPRDRCLTTITPAVVSQALEVARRGRR